MREIGLFNRKKSERIIVQFDEQSMKKAVKEAIEESMRKMENQTVKIEISPEAIRAAVRVFDEEERRRGKSMIKRHD